ncbi:hypothetical protein [Vibrio phage V-YDF132]|nr:hypothetical protein [Vibrio phage V-YDF132]
MDSYNFLVEDGEVNAELIVPSLKYLAKTQVSVIALKADDTPVDGALTGTVKIDGIPVGTDDADSAFTQTLDLATNNTVTIEGFFSSIVATPTAVTGTDIAKLRYTVSQK